MYESKDTPNRLPVVIAALLGAAIIAFALASPVMASGKVASTKAGVKKAKWGRNLTVTYGAGKVRLRSNGIPNHPRPPYYAVPNAGVVVPTAETARAVPDPTRATSLDFKITLKPKRSSKTTEAPLGSIGMMISGAVLYNPYEGDGTTVAMSSNFSLLAPDGSQAPFVDSCSGHPGGGSYHYHALPICAVARMDTGSGPSRMIGIAFDGYPIYGPRDVKGKKVPVRKLDRCNGIFSKTPEFPKGIYHYVLPGTSDQTSSIRCFRGEVDPDLITDMPAMGPGQGMPPGGPPPGAPLEASSRTGATAPASSLVCDLTDHDARIASPGAV
ncbi:MAG: YHYH protein [Solirubrobacterales bacterium]